MNIITGVCPRCFPLTSYKKLSLHDLIIITPVFSETKIKSASQLERKLLVSRFKQSWKNEEVSCPTDDEIEHVFIIHNQSQHKRLQSYRQTLISQTVEEHYHGTKITCHITNDQKLCCNRNCGACGITMRGFKKCFIRQSKRFQRFGLGFYLAPNSSKCHAYTSGAHGYRAMLVCDVCPGKKYTTDKDNETLVAPPLGYDSVHGSGGVLNYDEIVLFDSDAILPKAIVVYKKDGVAEIPNICSTQTYNTIVQSKGLLLLYGTLTSLMFVYLLYMFI